MYIYKLKHAVSLAYSLIAHILRKYLQKRVQYDIIRHFWHESDAGDFQVASCPLQITAQIVYKVNLPDSPVKDILEKILKQGTDSNVRIKWISNFQKIGYANMICWSFRL